MHRNLWHSYKLMMKNLKEKNGVNAWCQRSVGASSDSYSWQGTEFPESLWALRPLGEAEQKQSLTFSWGLEKKITRKLIRRD